MTFLRTRDEGEGDPLKGCGLPLSLHLTPWAFIGFIPFFCSEENPCTIFCRPMGGEWAISI